MESLARSIAVHTPTHSAPEHVLTQTIHRLNILARWFGSIGAAQERLRGRRVLEIGCGQGDMTALLAYLVAGFPDATPPSDHKNNGPGKVFALDTAPLTYGSPLTLGQCQEGLTNSQLGHAIQWIQMDPVDYLTKSEATRPDDFKLDFIIFAHSLFYVESEGYLKKLLQSLGSWVSDQEPSKRPQMLVAEWGMRTSVPAAELHILVVKALAADTAPCGNVRTVVTPERIKQLAHDRGWHVDREDWVESPKIDDGRWELNAARKMQDRKETLSPEARKHLDQMLQLLVKGDDKVACMDAWTGVFSLGE
ncbi:hypothetical protein LTR85_007456 [Meristemomyces frigidus]|nr:hypothetical protein LTR85_007456 [Meristemomyces frigidus]